MNASLARQITGPFASKISGQFAPVLGGQFTRFLQKANISLLRTNTIFTQFENSADSVLLGCLLGAVLITILFLCYFSVTRLGLFIRATGDNELMVRSQGINTDLIYIFGIGMANSLIALSGGLVAQSQGFADISMGVGLIITALAALIIGESFLSLLQSTKRKFIRTVKILAPKWNLPWDTFNEYFAALLGSFFYFLIMAICLQLGLAQTDLKLATGILVILGISLRFKTTTSETYYKGRL